MKVLLINPNSSVINKSWAYKKFFTPIAPLGLAYIASVLEKDRLEVSIMDQFATKLTDNDLLRHIREECPQVVGFSVLTPVFPDTKKLVAAIRSINKTIKIVLGNIHPTCFPEMVLEEGLADIVVRGEGEMSMLEVCQRLRCGEGLEGVKGVSYYADGEVLHNPDRQPVADLDSLPLPAWHLINPDDYMEVPLAAINKSRSLPISASRGCLYKCYYCSQDKIYSTVRCRNPEKVVDEMEYFHNKMKTVFFGFNDAYFPLDEESGLAFCDLIIRRNLHKKIKWCVETRVDKVTLRLLKAMKEAGVHLIMYGVEVGNKNILTSLNKNTSLEQAETALSQTRKAGILSQGLFILGLPGETIETCNDTIKFAKRLDCDIAKFNMAIPYPGSQFFEEYKKLMTVHSLEKFTSWFDWIVSSQDLVFTPDGMDSLTLRNLQRKAMIEFYMRPKIIFRHIFKNTISYKNFIFGGFWIIYLLCLKIKTGIRNRLGA